MSAVVFMTRTKRKSHAFGRPLANPRLSRDSERVGIARDPERGAFHPGEPMNRGEFTQVGLCVRCRHARVVETPRSRFWRCGLSDVDPGFPRYPRLPVLECRGYEPAAEDEPEIETFE